MNLGEFRKRTEHLPDDTDIVMEYDPCDYYESNIQYLLNPVMDNPYAILLHGGQPINLDLDLDARIDAALAFGDAEENG